MLKQILCNISLSTGSGDGSTSNNEQLIIIPSTVVPAVVLIGAGIAVLAVVIFCIRRLQKHRQSHNAQSDESNLELQLNKGMYLDDAWYIRVCKLLHVMIKKCHVFWYTNRQVSNLVYNSTKCNRYTLAKVCPL